MIGILLFVLSVIVFGLPGHALAVEDDTLAIGEVVVISAPVIEGNIIDRYGSGKTSITREQINGLNAQDMTSALRRTPGVNISRYNPVGSFGGGEGGAVFIRGMGSSRPGSEIKTYIDGVPMYMSIWNHPLMDLMPIDAGQSVDVFKSPQPQVFGNAMAGINLVPRVWSGQGYGSRLEFSAGSHETRTVTAETGGRNGVLDYYAGGGHRRSDGHREHAGGETGNGYGRIGYRLNPNWDVALFGVYSDNSAEDPGKEGADPEERLGTYETRAGLFSLTVSNAFGAADGYVKVFHTKGEGDWLDQPTDTDGVTEDLFNDFSFYGIRARETFRPFAGSEGIVGLDWETAKGDYEARYSDGTLEVWDGHEARLMSPYVAISHDYFVSKGISLTPSAGIRYYDHSDFGNAWSPHAGLRVDAGAFSGHAGYSRGVVFPGLDVVVFSQEVITALGDSWKELDPEMMDHYEAGITWAPGSLFSMDLTWFYNDGRDRYVFVTSPGAKPVYDNVETFVTKGIEASVSLFPRDNLALFIGAAFMKSEPSDLPYAPEVTVSAGMNWNIAYGVAVHLDAEYQDDMTTASQARKAGAENTDVVDDFFIMNLKVSWNVPLPCTSPDLTVYAAAENLTDTDYEYQSGYPMPGRSIMFGAVLSF